MNAARPDFHRRSGSRPSSRAQRTSPIGRIARLLAALVTLLGLASAARGQAGEPAKLHVVSVGEPATLTVWHRPIVTLRARIDELEPSDRVERARNRIAELPASALREEVSVARGQLNNLSGCFINVGSHLVCAVLPEDVDPDSTQTVEQFAEATAERLREVLSAQLAQREWPQLLRGIGLSLAATAAFVALIWLIVRVHRAAQVRQEAWLAKRRLAFLGVNLTEFLIAFERLLAKLTVVGTIVVAAYLWLAFVFAQFPYTQPWGTNLGRFLYGRSSELGSAALRAVPGLFTVLLIFLIARGIGRAMNSFFQRVEQGQIQVPWLEPDSAKATRRIAIALLWLFALIVAYPYVPGSSSEAFKGVSVFAGLMLTLGSAGVVNQVMSGLVLVYSRALKPGDYVSIGDVEGTVTFVGVLSTKVTTPNREDVTIPNAVVAGGKVTNYTRLAENRGSMAATKVTIGYDTPWRQVHALLLAAADRTDGVRKEPAPTVLQRALGDFYVEYELRVHLELPTTRVVVLSALHAHIQDAFNEFGVQIMSPHFMTQPGEKVFVPRERWSEPPAASDAQTKDSAAG